MKHSILKSFAVIIVVCFSLSAIALAQRNRTTTAPTSNLLSSLPPSDAVAIVNVKRVIDEALPKLLAENPAKLAEVTAELARFKTQTGLDPRSFEQVALGMSYSYPRKASPKSRQSRSLAAPSTRGNGGSGRWRQTANTSNRNIRVKRSTSSASNGNFDSSACGT